MKWRMLRERTYYDTGSEKVTEDMEHWLIGGRILIIAQRQRGEERMDAVIIPEPGFDDLDAFIRRVALESSYDKCHRNN
jgi:hypothetical protein